MDGHTLGVVKSLPRLKMQKQETWINATTASVFKVLMMTCLFLVSINHGNISTAGGVGVESKQTESFKTVWQLCITGGQGRLDWTLENCVGLTSNNHIIESGTSSKAWKLRNPIKKINDLSREIMFLIHHQIREIMRALVILELISLKEIEILQTT